MHPSGLITMECNASPMGECLVFECQDRDKSGRMFWQTANAS